MRLLSLTPGRNGRADSQAGAGWGQRSAVGHVGSRRGQGV